MKKAMGVKWSVGVLAVAAEAMALTPIPALAGPDCGAEVHHYYDGVSDDLLTAGLGGQGLAQADFKSQALGVPELRRLAIYRSYMGLVDTTREGGYGVFYGPHLAADGRARPDGGRVPGDEYLKFEEEDSCRGKVTMMVQIPDSYDPANGCIIAAASPGSRGIYGAIAVAEWGLRHNCAMAFTDKGTGAGADDLFNGTVTRMDGRRGGLFEAASNFTAPLDAVQRLKLNSDTPYRFAFKHAHSQRNPEKDWGQNVLRTIRYAFSKLNGKFAGKTEITKKNTIVIAASISNGGGAALRAVEEDKEGLIQGVVAEEPNITPRVEPQPFSIQLGKREPFRIERTTPLLDYVTHLNLYQGCANLASGVKNAAYNQNYLSASASYCESLYRRNLLKKSTVAEQANEAQKLINDYGILSEQNSIQADQWNFGISQALSVNYVNAAGRFSVADNVCKFSYGSLSSSGDPALLGGENEAQLFSTSEGIPANPTNPTKPDGVYLINDNALGPSKAEYAAPVELRVAGAACLRASVTGQNIGAVGAISGGPTSEQSERAFRIKRGAEESYATGNLHGVPAIIVTGRSDGVIAPNFASRAYLAVNALVEKSESQLRYYEVTNAHHFDALNKVGVYSEQYIPLYVYFGRSMDLMLSHLRHHEKLPPSQVIHTTPRGAGAPQIGAGNVPHIAQAPTSEAQITMIGDTLHIPD